MTDIFNVLWVEKYRPQTLSDLTLSDENYEYFKNVHDTIPHLLFCSPPGQGKTTLAKIIVHDILKCQYIYINASDENGVDNIRNRVITFAQTRSIDGRIKVVILDEADNLSGDAQRVLRNVMEEYANSTRFILTANYQHRIIEPLQSRCQIFDLAVDLTRFTKRVLWILTQENIKNISLDIASFIKKRYPDFRRTINDLQKCCVTGSLKLTNESLAVFAQEVLEDILSKKDVFLIRSKVIENEQNFNNDYQKLLKDLFNAIFTNTSVIASKKTMMLLHVSEAMYRDNQVIDREINFYACILHLNSIY